ncbi:MAG: hypothetical protein KC418_14965 [Anaerolineales bacterium]|nr:hypothetical protein [Anaerolineales bacterium]MCB8954535.1 hypothetical protein [Ardenticatenales bacterium]
MTACADHPAASLSNTAVAHSCHRHTELFWQGQPFDPCFCLALWQRALAQPLQEESKQAWAFVHHQYLRQVTIWVKRHPHFPHTGQEPEPLAALALEKMWLSFRRAPDKFSQFAREDAGISLKSLLQFLKMCVHGIVMDALTYDPRTRPLADTDTAFLAAPTAETTDLAAFWRCIYERLQDDDERLILDAMFVYGLKPRQIQDHYDNRFTDVKRIYRIKENVLARFRRDHTLRDCLEAA